MNLIIDEGNSFIKLAVFDENKIIDSEKVTRENSKKTLLDWCEKYNFQVAILSSVTDLILSIFEELPIKKKLILSNETEVPFKNLYQTPHTLGVDRIALVTAAYIKFPKKNCLIIDMGTCITYDFINSEGSYMGGAISLGVEMRFKSLHYFTQKLPQVTQKEEVAQLEGNTTESSIQSGVLNGIVFEIEGVINSYREKYGDVNIILTGGDANFLRKQLKNSIFVDPNFLLEGLNEVLMYQKTNERK